eukprot:INCI4197.1.p1 GENE.INCI4197.1~~INCI4197.1.p1  ORF type:complete len:689 (-),score=123.23 INCI4197.1:3196-5181(-)
MDGTARSSSSPDPGSSEQQSVSNADHGESIADRDSAEVARVVGGAEVRGGAALARLSDLPLVRSLSLSSRFAQGMFYIDGLDKSEVTLLGPIVAVNKAETMIQHSFDACGYYALYNALAAVKIARADDTAVFQEATSLHHRGRFIDWFRDARIFLGKEIRDSSVYATVHGYQNSAEILEPPDAQRLLARENGLADDISIFQHFAIDAMDASQIRRLHKVFNELKTGARDAHTIMFGTSGHWLSMCVFTSDRGSPSASPTPCGGAAVTSSHRSPIPKLSFVGEAEGTCGRGKSRRDSASSPRIQRRRFEVVLFDSDVRKTFNPDIGRISKDMRDRVSRRASGCRSAVQFVARCLRRDGGVAATAVDDQCGQLLHWLCEKAYDPPLTKLSQEVLETPGAFQWAREEAGLDQAGPQATESSSVGPGSSVSTVTVVVQESDKLYLPPGTAKSIVSANYGYDGNQTDVTMMVSIFLTPQGGVEHLAVTNDSLGTQGSTRYQPGKKRLHVVYEPREAPKPATPKVTENLEMLGEAQNLRLFIQTVTALLDEDGMDIDSPDLEQSAVNSTLLTVARRRQLHEVLLPVIRAARGYDEEQVLTRMHTSATAGFSSTFSGIAVPGAFGSRGGGGAFGQPAVKAGWASTRPPFTRTTRSAKFTLTRDIDGKL